jgi:hypothetical protein
MKTIRSVGLGLALSGVKAKDVGVRNWAVHSSSPNIIGLAGLLCVRHFFSALARELALNGSVATLKSGHRKGSVLHPHHLAIWKSPAMKSSRRPTLPTPTRLACPFRIACIASYPWIVRHAPQKDRKP